MKKRLISMALALLLLLSIVPAAFAAETADWPSFRGNDANNGITHVQTPRNPEEAELKWAVKYSTGWSGIPSPVIIAEDHLFVMCDNILKKLSMEDGSVVASAEMVAASSWGTTPALYADGKIFCQLGSSNVQAFDAKTLESLWVYTDDIKGQGQSPITYSDGKIYIGFGYGAESPFVCLDATTGEKVWRVTDPKGWYWAGAVVVGNSVIYGTESGKLYSRNKLTGELITELVCSETAMIRSTVSYDNGKIYWMLNNATVCRANIDENTGVLTDLTMKTIYENAWSTSTIAICDGILYTAAGSYKGGFYVVALDADTLEVLWEQKQPAYPQCSMLVSDAYLDSGYVYLYTTYNNNPGGLNVIKAKADGSEAETITLYTPDQEFQNYCICSVVTDKNGTLYYKNDSGTIFAIGLTEEAKNSNAAASVIKSINAIGEVTLSSRTAITSARSAYDALTETQKALVTNYETLTTAEARWEALRQEATKDPIHVSVTIANKGSAVMLQKSVTVTDINKNGIFDVDDALYAAHESGFEGGASAGYASAYSQWGLGITMLWGDTSGSFGYWLNDASCWSLEDAVAEGDHLIAFVYSDGTTWSDAYAKFEKNSYTSISGTAITAKLEIAGYDSNWNTVFSAHSGAKISVCDSNGKALTDGFSVQDNADGTYTVTVEKEGCYYLVATGNDPLIVPAVCALTVQKATDVPPTGDGIGLIALTVVTSLCGIVALLPKKKNV